MKKEREEKCCKCHREYGTVPVECPCICHLPPQKEESKRELTLEDIAVAVSHNLFPQMVRNKGKEILDKVLESQPPQSEDSIDNFVRDVCSVVPKSKSEVRRRLIALLEKETYEAFKRGLDGKPL